MSSGFDKLAAPYRWMEYLSFGRALERCRFYFLPVLTETKRALLLGDGDGRFTAALLRGAAGAHAVAVDASDGMLGALEERCSKAGVADRVTMVRADLRDSLPGALEAACFDVIATHFLLDCLSDAEVDRLVAEVTCAATGTARWVVSEFHLVDRGVMRPVSRLVVRALYSAFHVLTGLRADRLPHHANALQRHGWRVSERRFWLGGLLCSELWERKDGARMDCCGMGREWCRGQ